MRQSVPFILSTTALVVALLGSTPLGDAAGKLVQTVPPFAKRAGFAKYAGTADNAKLLSGHKALSNPAPGVIPVTGADGKIPTSFGTVGPQGPTGAQGAVRKHSEVQVRAPSNTLTDIPFAVAVFC